MYIRTSRLESYEKLPTVTLCFEGSETMTFTVTPMTCELWRCVVSCYERGASFSCCGATFVS